MLALLTFATLLPVASRASDPGDETQLWNELKVTARVMNNIDLVAAGALRLEGNYSDLALRGIVAANVGLKSSNPTTP